jgi:hypothetical protein
MPRKTPGIIANLTPASGRQNHTTSPYAAICVSSLATAASTASRPNVRDDGQRPSSRDRTAEEESDLGRKKTEMFFWIGLDRPNHLEGTSVFHPELFATIRGQTNCSSSRPCSHKVAPVHRLINLVDIARRPHPVIERLLGTVEPEAEEITLAWLGRDPVRLHTHGCLRAEIQVDAAVRIFP